VEKLSGLLIIHAFDKASVLAITAKIPSALKEEYQILVLKPGVEVEGVDELLARLDKQADVLITKHKKGIYKYVG
jgi:cell division FtsZ-interacting protein ZapD